MIQAPVRLAPEGTVNPLYRLSSDELAPASPLMVSLPSVTAIGTPQGRVTSLASPAPFALPATATITSTPALVSPGHPGRHVRASIGQTLQPDLPAAARTVSGSIPAVLAVQAAAGAATQPDVLADNAISRASLQPSLPAVSLSSQSEISARSGSPATPISTSLSAQGTVASSAPASEIPGGSTGEAQAGGASNAPFAEGRGSAIQLDMPRNTSVSHSLGRATVAGPGFGTQATPISGSALPETKTTGASPLFGGSRLQAGAGSGVPLFPSSTIPFGSAFAGSSKAAQPLFGGTTQATAASSRSGTQMCGDTGSASAFGGQAAFGSAAADTQVAPIAGRLPLAVTAQQAFARGGAHASSSDAEIDGSPSAGVALAHQHLLHAIMGVISLCMIHCMHPVFACLCYRLCRHSRPLDVAVHMHLALKRRLMVLRAQVWVWPIIICSVPSWERFLCA
jgi:hypothetical protein